MDIRCIALFAGCCLTIPLAKTALKISLLAHSGEILIYSSKRRFFGRTHNFFQQPIMYIKETLIKSFGKAFLSEVKGHERIQFVQNYPILALTKKGF